MTVAGMVRAYTVATFAAGTMLTAGSTAALSNDNCRRLEDLARQYAGVTLTADQKRLKRRLVAWYNGNCKRTRNIAEARR